MGLVLGWWRLLNTGWICDWLATSSGLQNSQKAMWGAHVEVQELGCLMSNLQLGQPKKHSDNWDFK